MITALTVLHAVVSFLLIIVVLLQFGKGAELGATMGGSSQSIFSSSQKGNILTKVTTALAMIFLVNSIFLSLLANKRTQKSLMENETSAVPLNRDALPNPEAPAAGPSQETTPKTK